ncbi:MFS transporter [Amycolatopsis sp. CA-161197]|uniref:MFS transporter n=1 Tax=Amycolatopsis sp. CA-161197 TaxID=3239922 RepID=UPI003D8B68D6
MSAGVPPAAARLETVIGDRRVGRFHVLLLALTGSVMFLDGLDTQAISFVAPVVAKEWHLPVAALGPLFSASIVGLMVGYLLLAPLAARIEHRRLIALSVALFGVFTLLCVFATNETQLIVFRFFTGVGLGGAIPSAVALASEFAPARRRSTFVMFSYCWLALGFVAASLLSGVLIPAWGWRSIFVLGGVLPLAVSVVLAVWLPRSPVHLLQRGEHAELHATLRRLAPDLDPRATFVLDEPAAGKATRRDVLGRNRLAATLLLWLAFALNLGVFYAVLSWLPTVLLRLGHPTSTAVTATALVTVGGIVAALVIGPAMDKRGAFATLGTVYLIGSALIAVLGFALTGSSGLLLVAAFLAGTCVTGGQMSVIALAAVLYPPRIRSTGVGWALGIGRAGGIVGPLLVGAALGAGAGARVVFLVMAAVFLLASGTVAVMSRVSRPAEVPVPQADPRPATAG